MTIALTHFAAPAGDHNDRALSASALLAAVLATRLSTPATVIGEPRPAHPAAWDDELAAALPSLWQLSARYDDVLGAGATPVTALGRCAMALATLPVVATHRPDAVVVWFDAHADLNTPLTSPTGYLGGLALSGPLGMWQSGLGSGLAATNTVLVGTRDLDDAEQRLVDDSRVALVRVGASMADDLGRVVAGRPVYVHIDCDVLDPGIVPTDYAVPGGMTLAHMVACAQVLGRGEVVGIEIAELETDDRQQHGPHSFLPARTIALALEPLLQAVDIDSPAQESEGTQPDHPEMRPRP